MYCFRCSHVKHNGRWYEDAFPMLRQRSQVPQYVLVFFDSGKFMGKYVTILKRPSERLYLLHTILIVTAVRLEMIQQTHVLSCVIRVQDNLSIADYQIRLEHWSVRNITAS